MLGWMNSWLTPFSGIPYICIWLSEVLTPAILKVFYLEGCHKRHNLLSNRLSSCHLDHIPNGLSSSSTFSSFTLLIRSPFPPLPSLAGLLTLPWTYHIFFIFLCSYSYYWVKFQVSFALLPIFPSPAQASSPSHTFWTEELCRATRVCSSLESCRIHSHRIY